MLAQTPHGRAWIKRTAVAALIKAVVGGHGPALLLPPKRSGAAPLNRAGRATIAFLEAIVPPRPEPAMPMATTRWPAAGLLGRPRAGVAGAVCISRRVILHPSPRALVPAVAVG